MSCRSCLNKLNSSPCCSGCFPPGWWLEVIKAHPALKQVFNYLNIFRPAGEFFLLWCSNRATPYHIHNILLSTWYISRHSLIRVTWGVFQDLIMYSNFGATLSRLLSLLWNKNNGLNSTSLSCQWIFPEKLKCIICQQILI